MLLAWRILSHQGHGAEYAGLIKPHIVPNGRHKLRHPGKALDTFHVFLSAFDQSLVQTMAQRHPCSAVASTARMCLRRGR